MLGKAFVGDIDGYRHGFHNGEVFALALLGFAKRAHRGGGAQLRPAPGDGYLRGRKRYAAVNYVADALFAADERQRFRNVLRFALCFGTALEAHRCFAEKHAAAVLRVHCRNGCLALHGDIAAEQRSYAYLARCQNAAFDAAAIGFGGSGYVLLRAAAHRKRDLIIPCEGAEADPAFALRFVKQIENGFSAHDRLFALDIHAFVKRRALHADKPQDIRAFFGDIGIQLDILFGIAPEKELGYKYLARIDSHDGMYLRSSVWNIYMNRGRGL